jgi:hypothetical protein
MAKPVKKTKPVPVKRRPMDPEQAARLRRGAIRGALVFAFVATLSAAYVVTHRYVARRLAHPTAPPTVVLKNRPVWMSDILAEQITRLARPAVAHSAFDHQMLVDVTEALRGNPWIRKVRQVRRAYGKLPGDTLEIDCDYRAPVALVHWGDYFWLVDGDGVKLPEQFSAQQVPRIIVGQDRRINIRVIEGVKQPPPESGRKWTGDDLAAGLDMVKLLFGRPYVEEIVKVNVANYDGRIDQKEAQLVLVTKYGTEVRWGDPLAARNSFEVTPARKLENMRRVHEMTKRIDGQKRWIDVRFLDDAVTFPSTEVSGEGDSGRKIGARADIGR